MKTKCVMVCRPYRYRDTMFEYRSIQELNGLDTSQSLATLHWLSICSSTADSLSLKFNSQKSCCLACGPRYNDVIEPVNLGIGIIDWCSNFKYLGV